VRARPGGFRWKFFASASPHNSGSARLFVAGASFFVCDTAVLAGVADCPFALRAHERVLDTSGRVSALHAAQSYCPTFNSPLAGPVAFGRDPNLAAELFDWHGGGIIPRWRQRECIRASRCRARLLLRSGARTTHRGQTSANSGGCGSSPTPDCRSRPSTGSMPSRSRGARRIDAAYSKAGILEANGSWLTQSQTEWGIYTITLDDLRVTLSLILSCCSRERKDRSSL